MLSHVIAIDGLLNYNSIAAVLEYWALLRQHEGENQSGDKMARREVGRINNSAGHLYEKMSLSR